jgi:hypothetical protein
LPIKKSFRLWRIESHDQMKVNRPFGRPVFPMSTAPITEDRTGRQGPAFQGILDGTFGDAGLARHGMDHASLLIREIGASAVAALRRACSAPQQKGQDE